MANILVVDDENAMLQLIKRILEKDAHTVTLQANAKAVLNLDFRRYDLILLDIMMPDVDGFELCCIRRQPAATGAELNGSGA
ncbi:MAG: response regulator transcription factor, partial [Eubacterium sp.]